MGRNFAGLERDTMKKIVQTAGRNVLEKFAPSLPILMMMFFLEKTGIIRILM